MKKILLICLLYLLAYAGNAQSIVTFAGGEMIFTNLKPIGSSIIEKRSYPSIQVCVVINTVQNRISFNDTKGNNIDQFPLTNFVFSGATGVAAVTPFLTAKGAADGGSASGGGSVVGGATEAKQDMSIFNQQKQLDSIKVNNQLLRQIRDKKSAIWKGDSIATWNQNPLFDGVWNRLDSINSKIGYQSKEPTIWKSITNKKYVDSLVAAADIALYESITHVDLLVKIANSQLKIGKWYLINDYRTVYERPIFDQDSYVIDYETDQGNEEPLLVLAVDKNKMGNTAYSILYPLDKIEYDCNKILFPSIATPILSIKGLITRRIGFESQNDCYFDFRAVRYYLYSDNNNQKRTYPFSGFINSELVPTFDKDSKNNIVTNPNLQSYLSALIFINSSNNKAEAVTFQTVFNNSGYVSNFGTIFNCSFSIQRFINTGQCTNCLLSGNDFNNFNSVTNCNVYNIVSSTNYAYLDNVKANYFFKCIFEADVNSLEISQMENCKISGNITNLTGECVFKNVEITNKGSISNIAMPPNSTIENTVFGGKFENNTNFVEIRNCKFANLINVAFAGKYDPPAKFWNLETRNTIGIGAAIHPDLSPNIFGNGISTIWEVLDDNLTYSITKQFDVDKVKESATLIEF